MIPEIGHFSLILALLLALVQGTVPLYGAHKGIGTLTNIAKPVAQGQFVFVAIAFGALVYSLINNDFSVLYVAQHSNSHLPLHYRIAAEWGGHEGSLLLWVTILGIWSIAVTVFSRHLPDEMIARVLGVMGLVSVGFLLFMLLTSDPFARVFPVPEDGADLNPLLQDPGLVIHPPMLYMGYVGFSIAFAFAISALLSGKLDATWARWSRPWTTTAWIFLTLGIALGSGWAYYELGWGGWWFWDPVENASFMPWLVGTALMHALAVTEKRGSFKSWTVLLAIAAFSLSLLGTFLVRSGVLTSVHAFATDPRRGMFILIFLVTVIGSSLALYAWRAPKVGLGGKFDVVSRESLLLSNNVLLAVAATSVLLGTLYPLLVDALHLGKISVGPPYFNAIFVPLMVPMVFLMGLGPIASWKKASLPDLASRLKWAFGASVATAALLPIAMGKWTPLISLGFLLAAWVAFSSLHSFWHRIRHAEDKAAAIFRQSPSYYGMLLGHLGIAVFIVGVTMVKGYETERDVKMNVGDTLTIASYTFRFDGTSDVQGPNYQATRGFITVMENGRKMLMLHPEKRSYNASGMMMTIASINPGITRDLYVSLGEPIGDSAWSVRIYYKPFVDWIWVGCLIMAIGGIFAVADRRYRLAIKAKNAATSDNLQPAMASK
ncbi:MAG: heme lyase CcmF/NrfE family subunit [Burkholderiales bacterium]|nr:heme lyase CcmF/NrfE family subunit [Burkholderiales bacterium]